MVFEKIAEIVAVQLGVDRNTITMGTDLEGDLGADELDIYEIGMAIAGEFYDAEFEEEELGKLRTVGDLVEFISARGQYD